MITKTTTRKILPVKEGTGKKRYGHPQSQKTRASASLNWLHRTLAGISTSNAMYQVAKEHELLLKEDPTAVTQEQKRFLMYLQDIVNQMEDLRKKAINDIKHINNLKK